MSEGLGCALVMELSIGGHAFICLSKNKWNLGEKNVEVDCCSFLWLTGKKENSHFLVEGKILRKAKLQLSSLFLWVGAAAEPFPGVFIFEVPDCFSCIPL